MRTRPPACPTRWPGHRIGPAAPGWPLGCARPRAPIPAARGAGKCQGGLSRKRKQLGPGNPASAGPACAPADLRTNPTHIAAIPNGIARTPHRTNTSPTPTHVAFQRQRTSPDAGGRKHADCGKNRRTDRAAGSGDCLPLRVTGGPRRSTQVAGRQVARCGCERGVRMPPPASKAPIAGVCREPIVAATKPFEGAEHDQGHFRSA